MRIRLHASDRLPFWIIGDPSLNERTEASEALSENVQITRNQQTVTGAEWEAKSFYDRGNQSVTLEATARREFTTEWERHQFLEMLAPTDLDEELHRWQGDIYLRFPNADGTFHESVLPEAVLSLSGKQLDGAVGVRLTYRIQAPGFDIAASQSGVEKVSLVADGIVVGQPVIDFFATETGGAATDPVDSGNIWLAADESTGTWSLWFEVRYIVGGVSDAYLLKLCFGGSESGFTLVGALPMTGHLAAMAAAFDSDYIRAEVLTVGGRQCLRLTMVRESEEIATDGSGHTPFLRLMAYYRSSGGIDEGIKLDLDLSESRTTEEDLWLIDARGVHLISDRMT